MIKTSVSLSISKLILNVMSASGLEVSPNTVLKPEILIVKLVDQIATKFQRQIYHVFGISIPNSDSPINL